MVYFKKMKQVEIVQILLTLFRGEMRRLIIALILFTVLLVSCGNKVPNEAKEAMKALNGIGVVGNSIKYDTVLSPYLKTLVPEEDLEEYNLDTEDIKQLNQLVREYDLDKQKQYTPQSIEKELIGIYNNTIANLLFRFQLKKILSAPLTFDYPFEELGAKTNLKKMAFAQNGICFYSYDEHGGTRRFYRTFMQYYNSDKLVVKELSIDNELLYDVYRIQPKEQTYFVLFSYGKYSSRLWSENIRVATINNGDVKFHTQYFPEKFQNNKIKQEAHEEDFVGNNEGYSLPINGYIRGNCFTLQSRGSLSARTINLTFDEQTLSVSYDELSKGLDHLDRFVDPTGKRITWNFEF